MTASTKPSFWASIALMGRDDWMNRQDECRHKHLTGLLSKPYQHHLHGLLDADETWKALSSSQSGDHAERELRKSELGAQSAHPSVASHSELEASTKGESIDRGDDGLAVGLHPVQPLLLVLEHGH